MGNVSNLFELAKKRGITSKVIAEISEVLPSAVSEWKSGRATPSVAVLQKLADYFNVSIDYLLGRETPKNTEKITLPLFNTPVSAGTGAWLTDTEEFEEKEFNAEDIPYNADFALIVRGDSMEPNYSDGDIVFVKKDVIVEPNQIGIFCLNDNGYIKKLAINYLISLNKKYPPIEIGEYDTFYTIGRVVGKIEEE
jgi:SOS-response transcriptional repressor LexA